MDIGEESVDEFQLFVNQDIYDKNKDIIHILWEELSVLNDAMEYKEWFGDDIRSISDFAQFLENCFYTLLTEINEPDNKINAYELVAIQIPTIITGLRWAKKLSQEEANALNNLEKFAQKKEKLLNNSTWSVVYKVT